MSRTTQLESQFTAWIKKGRWNALLKWFNESPARDDAWKIFFNAAKHQGLQQHWTQYMDFLQKHVTNALSATTFFSYQQQKHVQDEHAWKVLSLALPHFFSKALPFLEEPYRQEQAQTLLTMIKPWLPEPKTSYSIVERARGAIVFGLLANADAWEQWKDHEMLFDAKFGPDAFLAHAVGKDFRWTEILRERYFSSAQDGKSWRSGKYDEGNLDRSWREGLLRNGGIEQLAKEPVAYPVARTFLEAAIDELARKPSAEAALLSVYTRYPRLRLWIELSISDDAQACQAMLATIKEKTLSPVASTLMIARHLDVPLGQWVALLDAPTPSQHEEYNLAGTLFESLEADLNE